MIDFLLRFALTLCLALEVLVFLGAIGLNLSPVTIAFVGVMLLTTLINWLGVMSMPRY